MIYRALFIILFLAISKEVPVAAAQECSSQPPADGSGAPDLQQVTTMPYCYIDDCAIENYETGQQLDIAYTTDSVLVVTPKGNQTSMVINKIEEEFDCAPLSTVYLLLPIVLQLMLMLVNTDR
ncbi:uncharacterized protein [Dysidea avara]|uniref:uncharacterized protein n=1 Tax=Dysidea avara TaxID=196820 RepID=UPI003332AC83